MNQTSTAPACIVIGCEALSALTDVTRGSLMTYHAHYCAACYQDMMHGKHLPVDPARLELRYAGEEAAEDRSSLTEVELSKRA